MIMLVERYRQAGSTPTDVRFQLLSSSDYSHEFSSLPCGQELPSEQCALFRRRFRRLPFQVPSPRHPHCKHEVFILLYIY